MCSSSRSKPAAAARSVAATNCARTSSMSARVISRGVWCAASHGIGDGAISGQLPSSSGSLSPSHISFVEPLRPACPSCAPIALRECVCTKSTIRFHAAVCSSRYRPPQPGVIRPSADVQIISVITSPAPPRARAPRCTRWKSPGVPSTDVYMSIGDTTTRLPSSSSRSRKGVNIGGAAATDVDELRVAQLELAERDPARAREQVEREPARVLVHVAADPLEPLQRALGRALGGLHDRPALGLVGVDVTLAHGPRERDRVLHRELGAGPDREVRGVRRVAEQDDVLAPPERVADGDEVDPARAVLDQAVAEQVLALRLVELHPAALDDERRAGAASTGTRAPARRPAASRR